MNVPERGYLYVAGGNPAYVREAGKSAGSLKHVDKNAHVSLITDGEVDAPEFDNVIVRPGGDFSSYRWALEYRVRHVYESSPYQKTLALDTDTYFFESCAPLFDILDYFDVCMALAPGDLHVPTINGVKLEALTPYNCGVIAFAKNERNRVLFARWHEIYHEKVESGELERTKGTDQTSFMLALLESQSRVFVMPNIWNARTTKYIALKGTVKLAHGRHDDYATLQKHLNASSLGRCWDPKQGRCISPSAREMLQAKLLKRLERVKRR